MTDPFIITAIPYQVNNNDILEPVNTANSLMNYFQCGYMNGKLMDVFAGYCSSTIKSIVKKELQYFTIRFKKLTWTFSAVNTNFKISISPPLSYMRVNFSANDTVSRYPSTKYSDWTTLITVTNVPTSISILNTLPGIIFVGDTIQVQVSCLIASGSPVPRTQILASIVSVQTTAEDMLESELQKMLIFMATGRILIFLTRAKIH